MIHIIMFSKELNNVNVVKKHVDACCSDIECTYLSFEYPMDILDYLNTARPERCAVFFMTDNLSEGLEISSKVNEINSAYRFNLMCSSYGDVEELFYNGVTYFIRTPCDVTSIHKCSHILKRYYEEKSRKSIQLKSKNGMENIFLSDIDYVMSDKRTVIVKSQKYERVFYYKLDEIEEMLGAGFLRCHQSFIVNMTKIKQFIDDALITLDDTTIPVSRKRYYASKREYLAYITGNHNI